MTAFLILASLMALLFVGVPVAFSLGGLGLFLMWLGDLSPLMVPQGLYSSTDNFVLLAVPMFLLMSNVLLKGGVGHDLFAAVQSWVGTLARWFGYCDHRQLRHFLGDFRIVSRHGGNHRHRRYPGND